MSAVIVPLHLPKGERAQEVERVSGDLLELARAMRTLAKARQSEALAAPELGIMLRIIAGEIQGWPFILFNPVIASRAGTRLEVYALSTANVPTKIVVDGHKARVIEELIWKLQ